MAPVDTPTTSGDRITGGELVAERHAAVLKQVTEVVLMNQQPVTVVTYTVAIVFDPNIQLTTRHFLVLDGHVLNIQRFYDLDEKHDWWILICVRTLDLFAAGILTFDARLDFSKAENSQYFLFMG
jgi:hypothetical protein